jgi:hypothetical protein
MSELRPLVPHELRALLAHEREIEALPETTRARMLARARASLVAGVARPVRRPARASVFRWAAAAAIVCVAGVAAGAVAYEVRARFAPQPAPAPAPAPRVVRAPVPVRDGLSATPAEVTRSVRPTARPSASSVSDAARAELALMGQARAAVARGDYAGALAPIAEHARRFRDGRLAEEREALRVKTLVGLGRVEEAQRAASAFQVRFPRSVLSPAVRQMSGSLTP